MDGKQEDLKRYSVPEKNALW